MGDILMEHLQNHGVGRLLCRDLGISMDEYEVDITSYLWGVRIDKHRGGKHEQLTIFDDRILLSRGSNRDNLHIVDTFKNIREYRTR